MTPQSPPFRTWKIVIAVVAIILIISIIIIIILGARKYLGVSRSHSLLLYNGPQPAVSLTGTCGGGARILCVIGRRIRDKNTILFDTPALSSSARKQIIRSNFDKIMTFLSRSVNDLTKTNPSIRNVALTPNTSSFPIKSRLQMRNQKGNGSIGVPFETINSYPRNAGMFVTRSTRDEVEMGLTVSH